MYFVWQTEAGKLRSAKEKRNPRVYCHNCGGKGHFGYECEEERVNRYSPAVYPYIVRYYVPEEKAKTNRGTKGPRDTGDEPSSKRQKLEEGSFNRSPGRKDNRTAPVADRNSRDKNATNRNFTRDKHISEHAKHLLNPVTQNTKSKGKKKPKRKEIKNASAGGPGAIKSNPKTEETVVKNKKKKKKKKKKQRGGNKNNNTNLKMADLNTNVVRHQQCIKNNTDNSKHRQLNGRKRKTGKSDIVTHTDRGFNIVLPNLKKNIYK